MKKELWISNLDYPKRKMLSVFQNLFNILEAISNTSNRGFPEFQALQSWYNKLG